MHLSSGETRRITQYGSQESHNRLAPPIWRLMARVGSRIIGVAGAENFQNTLIYPVRWGIRL